MTKHIYNGLAIALLLSPFIGTSAILWGIHTDSFTYMAIGAVMDIIFVGIIGYILHDACIG